MRAFAIIAVVGGSTLWLSGCSILIGKVKPVAEKSEQYRYLDLSQESGWTRLSQEEMVDDSSTDDTKEDDLRDEKIQNEISDVAFQSKKTHSIISLNSACRQSFATSPQSLKSYTDLLFLGLSDIRSRKERKIAVSGDQALETTVQGNFENEPVMIRTVVTRKGPCIYDLTLSSRPRYFGEEAPIFKRFVQSVVLKTPE